MCFFFLTQKHHYKLVNHRDRKSNLCCRRTRYYFITYFVTSTYKTESDIRANSLDGKLYLDVFDVFIYDWKRTISFFNRHYRRHLQRCTVDSDMMWHLYIIQKKHTVGRRTGGQICCIRAVQDMKKFNLMGASGKHTTLEMCCSCVTLKAQIYSLCSTQ